MSFQTKNFPNWQYMIITSTQNIPSMFKGRNVFLQADNSFYWFLTKKAACPQKRQANTFRLRRVYGKCAKILSKWSENHFTVIAGLAACKQWRTDGIMILPPWTRHGIGRLGENRAGVRFPWSAAGAVYNCHYKIIFTIAMYRKILIQYVFALLRWKRREV